jgi:hypothetical protein
MAFGDDEHVPFRERGGVQNHQEGPATEDYLIGATVRAKKMLPHR